MYLQQKLQYTVNKSYVSLQIVTVHIGPLNGSDRADISRCMWWQSWNIIIHGQSTGASGGQLLPAWPDHRKATAPNYSLVQFKHALCNIKEKIPAIDLHRCVHGENWIH